MDRQEEAPVIKQLVVEEEVVDILKQYPMYLYHLDNLYPLWWELVEKYLEQLIMVVVIIHQCLDLERNYVVLRVDMVEDILIG